MTIYFHGCSSCGLTGMRIKKIQKYANTNGIKIDIRNSKYSTDDRLKHTALLKNLNIIDRYDSIILTNEGEAILLKDFSI